MNPSRFPATDASSRPPKTADASLRGCWNITVGSRLGGCALAALLGTMLGGCRAPQVKVARQLDALQAEWKTNVEIQSNLPEREIDWPRAVAMLRSNNLKLRQSRTETTNSHESVRQIFKDLIPSLNLRAGLAKRVENIASTGIDDVTFSADSFFNIPGLLSFSARLYTAKLFHLRSQAAYKLTEREQIIELYKLFLQAQDTQEHIAHLENQKTTASAFTEVDPFTGQVLMTEVELKEIASRKDKQSIQQRASDLLGDFSQRWVFVTNGLPVFHYEAAPLALDDTNRVAQLQLKLVAIELEAQRAQLQGIRMRYWPELNLFVSGPPIYQKAFGTERFWDASQLRASADLFWYIDTRGQVKRQMRQAKRQQAVQRERYRQESINLMQRLIGTQALLKSTLDKARQIDAQLEIMKAVPPAQNFVSLQRYVDDYRILSEQQRNLRREIAELNTLFWFVDESAWTEFAAPTLAAASSQLIHTSP